MKPNRKDILSSPFTVISPEKLQSVYGGRTVNRSYADCDGDGDTELADKIVIRNNGSSKMKLYCN